MAAKCARIGCPFPPVMKIWVDGEVVDHLCVEDGKSAKLFLESIELYENGATIERKRDKYDKSSGRR